MSAWHDPRGREIVDGYGKAIGRIPEGHHGPVYGGGYDENMLDWVDCRHCDGTIPAAYHNGEVYPFSRHHSCRPEHHR